MADHTVCCMCGDVGFPDKLFSCRRCRFRSQHSYCSSNYGESCSDICDWCQSEGARNATISRHGGSAARRSAVAVAVAVDARSEYVSGERIKQHEEVSSPTAATSGRNPGGGVPSSRQSTRRYKLLKDVKC